MNTGRPKFVLASESRDRLNEQRQDLKKKQREALDELRDVHEAEKDELRETMRASKRQKIKKEQENVPPPAAPVAPPQIIYAPPQQAQQMPRMQMSMGTMAPMPPPPQFNATQSYMQRPQYGEAWPRPYGY